MSKNQLFRSVFLLAAISCLSGPSQATEGRNVPLNSVATDAETITQARDTCDGQTPGDFNNDGEVNVSDWMPLYEYVCNNGPAPEPLANGDPNGDCVIDSSDIDYIAAYVFSGGPLPVECTCVEPIKGLCYVDTCDSQTPGDFNGDGEINSADPVMILDYLCDDGPPPDPLANGDPNGDCMIDTFDVYYLTEFLFESGPPPVECTCVEPAKGACPDTCHAQTPGDFNDDGAIDIADVDDLQAYLCDGGPAPDPLANGDPNGDCYINFADADYLLAYLYQGGPPPVECTCIEPIKGSCLCDCIPGDANGDGSVNVADAVYVIAYVFKGGPPPIPYEICSGDANCDCAVNVGDAVYIIAYVFKGGPAPCDCRAWVSECGSPLRK
jgi:hypothetical protein